MNLAIFPLVYAFAAIGSSFGSGHNVRLEDLPHFDQQMVLLKIVSRFKEPWQKPRLYCTMP